MEHLVARAVPGTVLFHDIVEARFLWFHLTSRVPNLVAACLMPDHVHVQTAGDGRRSFGTALRGFARWRNRTRGEMGPVFLKTPPAAPLATADKVRRSERYIHLNPCRDHLVGDPLAWPLSTYRDAVGLSVLPVRRPDPDPAATHAYTSADPTVNTRGTLLPMAQAGVPSLEEVHEAVASLTLRSPLEMRTRGPARTLFVRAARSLTAAHPRDIADAVGLCERAVYDVRALHDAQVQVVARVAGDPRFSAPAPGDFRRLASWRHYRHRR